MRWTPPRDQGLVGRFAHNDLLSRLSLTPVPGSGPEDVAVSEDGRVYSGLADGSIVAVDGGRVRVVARTGGRPLGIEIDADGSLIVCDSLAGLLRVDPGTGSVKVLVAEVAGRPLKFTNNAAVAGDGTIYFSDSSTTTDVTHFKADLLEHGGTGKVLRLDPQGHLDVIAEGLAFANGVALAQDESSLLVAETGAYRVSRIPLTGPGAGHPSVILDNLPGLPDNMSTGSNGTFWVAIPSLRNRLLDLLLPRPAFLRRLVWSLPDAVQPDASRIAFVLGIDEAGQVRHNLQADGSAYHYVTGIREAGGRLWLGSLVESAIASLEWPLPDRERS